MHPFSKILIIILGFLTPFALTYAVGLWLTFKGSNDPEIVRNDVPKLCPAGTVFYPQGRRVRCV